jgi:hypothetical protein
MSAVLATRLSAISSSYGATSSAYLVANALNASSVAEKMPARRPARLQPSHRPSGIIASPITSDSAWVADALEPNAWIQKCSSR